MRWRRSAPVVRIVIMGPSGSGKSLVGAALAARVHARFLDGDDLHPSTSIAKMRSGTPLTDGDREPWLDAVGLALARETTSIVVACSALRRAYRDRIRRASADAVFVELVVDAPELSQRMSRRDHFMPTALLDSQLATLEPLAQDETGFRVANDADLQSVVDRIVDLLNRAP
ncbi:gluconokinase [Microbacterium memoriense]|uniref:Gluconokinase n=1 Tax=Microbacterium memoriense TaxID=2978350 RepID=A0ABT2P9M8_9MICO|nr:gluconokinase, GntK/IdnK-type [Microbacterium memoriense]MCT9001306.1 gluconokinase, GntK/IdnK-type [Microbacterium memoriense]